MLRNLMTRKRQLLGSSVEHTHWLGAPRLELERAALVRGPRWSSGIGR
jgi:hypothetical protein